MIRLQKYLAQSGVASRRRAEVYISEGRVRVNGETVTALATTIDEDLDVVLFDGKEVKRVSELLYYMLHKPEGFVTTVSDQRGRKTVMDLLYDIETRVYPVGRLDYDTSGLLLMTNDGDLAYTLTHPSNEVEKTYIAGLLRRPDVRELSLFRRGIEIDGRKTAPAAIDIIKKHGELTIVKIVIKEGRNRQIRKMCQAIGCPVSSLKRVAVGKLYLGSLPRGEYRVLTKKEAAYLKSLAL